MWHVWQLHVYKQQSCPDASGRVLHLTSCVVCAVCSQHSHCHLQTMCGAIFDAILFHIVTTLSGNKWQVRTIVSTRKTSVRAPARLWWKPMGQIVAPLQCSAASNSSPWPSTSLHFCVCRTLLSRIKQITWGGWWSCWRRNCEQACVRH